MADWQDVIYSETLSSSIEHWTGSFSQSSWTVIASEHCIHLKHRVSQSLLIQNPFRSNWLTYSFDADSRGYYFSLYAILQLVNNSHEKMFSFLHSFCFSYNKAFQRNSLCCSSSNLSWLISWPTVLLVCELFYFCGSSSVLRLPNVSHLLVYSHQAALKGKKSFIRKENTAVYCKAVLLLYEWPTADWAQKKRERLQLSQIQLPAAPQLWIMLLSTTNKALQLSSKSGEQLETVQ